MNNCRIASASNVTDLTCRLLTVILSGVMVGILYHCTFLSPLPRKKIATETQRHGEEKKLFLCVSVTLWLKLS